MPLVKVFSASIKQILFVVLLLILLLTTTFYGQPQKTTQILPTKEPLENSLTSGQSHIYQIQIQANKLLRVRVQQKGVDVVVKLFNANQQLLTQADAPNSNRGLESLSWISSETAKYEIQIIGLGKGVKSSARYSIVGSVKSVTTKIKEQFETETMAKTLIDEVKQKGINKTSVEKLEEARKLYQQIGDRQQEAECWLLLGAVSIEELDRLKAREFYNQALQLYQSGGDKQGEINVLSKIADSYTSEPLKYIEYQNQILALYQSVGDKYGELSTVKHLGQIYRGSSFAGTSLKPANYQKSLEYHEKASILYKELNVDDREIELFIIYGDMASIYSRHLGNKNKALEYLNQATAYDKSVPYYLLEFIGESYFRLGDKQKAKEIYDKMLIKVLDNKYYNRLYLARIAKNYIVNFGESQKAFDSLNQALLLEKSSKNISGIGDVLLTISSCYEKIGDNQKAIEYLNQALAHYRFHQYKGDEAEVLEKLMSEWNLLGNKPLAIFYGKQSVNIYQEKRQSLQDLEKHFQQNYLKLIQGTYRKLADLLISEGRFPEAQSVLDILKEEEFKGLSKLRSGEILDTVPYSKAETDIAAKVDNLAKLESERTELLRLKEQGTLPPDKLSRLSQIPLEIESANKAFRLSLDALGKSESSVEDKVAEIKSEKNLQSVLSQLQKETASGAVALYTVLGTEAVKDEKDASAKEIKTKTKFGWIILVTPTSRKAYPIDVTDLEKTVFQFRDSLQSDKSDPKLLAQKLYQKLFRQTSTQQKTTLESDLETLLGKTKDKTLMWSLDGILRYVPMAALHDGKSYLAERYSNVIFTKESFSTLKDKNAPKWSALGLGVSEAQIVDLLDGTKMRFSALDGTKRELQDIVREPKTITGIMDGAIKLNKEFAKEPTLTLMREGTYPVIHIASHYNFNPSDPTSSFLLVGDGKLSFSEMQDKDNLFGSVDLLTLSACDTAMSGNGKEAEGFAYLAQSLGAKSVIASLWKVSDVGTPELMIRFYKLRAENPLMSKGEAFRQAQLSLLNGVAKDIKKPYAHPHFWSSFVLIGNWR